MFLPVGDNIDRKNLPILPGILVFINLAVFARQIRIFVDSPNTIKPTIDFITTWGLVPTDLEQGRYLGLVTHMFVHGGIGHIVGNMLCLWAFACSLEVGIGAWYLFGFYLFWGVGAGAIHAGMSWGSDIPLVGASGAIAGLMGAYTIIYGADAKIKTLFFLGFKVWVVHIPAALYGIGWYALQVWAAKNDVTEDGGGVAFYAHVGGFILGAVTAFCVKGDMDLVLTRDRDGELKFTSKDAGLPENYRIVEGDVYEYAENDVAGDGSTLPEESPSGGTAIGEDDQITPGVAKCPGAQCHRFVYPGAAIV
jgi:membrane associated rhomboid family serine protease